MEFLHVLPELPSNEGRLYTHPSGGEHAPRFAGKEAEFNPLGDYLTRKDGGEVGPITGKDLLEMQFDEAKTIVFVSRYDHPDKSAVSGHVAGGIATKEQGDFDCIIRVKELVVHPDLREKRIASYMLGNMQDLVHAPPTELVIDTTQYEIPEWLPEKLISAGFRHSDAHGSPATWLPGRRYLTREDTELKEVVDEIITNAPEGWKGYISIYPETDPQTLIFRGGLVGSIHREGDFHYDEDDIRRANFTVFDAGGAKLGDVSSSTEEHARNALLNNFGLVK